MEFAVVAGIVVVVIVSVFEMGMWVWERMILEAALNAGIHYAQGFPTDASAIRSVIDGSLPTAMRGHSTVSNVSRDCSSENAGNPVNGTCAFVTLSISYPFSPVYFSALAPANLLVVGYTIRVQ